MVLRLVRALERGGTRAEGMNDFFVGIDGGSELVFLAMGIWRLIIYIWLSYVLQELVLADLQLGNWQWLQQNPSILPVGPVATEAKAKAKVEINRSVSFSAWLYCIRNTEM